MSDWRKSSKAVIEKVMSDNPGIKGNELRRLLSDHYPFGVKANHPYKMWLAEVAAVCGKTRCMEGRPLTDRQQKIFDLANSGKNNQQIAHETKLHAGTVAAVLRACREKGHVISVEAQVEMFKQPIRGAA